MGEPLVNPPLKRWVADWSEHSCVFASWVRLVLDPFSLVDEPTGQTKELEGSIQKISGTTLWSFILAVFLAQAGLFAASLGLMLVGFRDQWTVGGVLFAGGLLALVITVGIHRWHRGRT